MISSATKMTFPQDGGRLCLMAHARTPEGVLQLGMASMLSDLHDIATRTTSRFDRIGYSNRCLNLAKGVSLRSSESINRAALFLKHDFKAARRWFMEGRKQCGQLVGTQFHNDDVAAYVAWLEKMATEMAVEQTGLEDQGAWLPRCKRLPVEVYSTSFLWMPTNTRSSHDEPLYEVWRRFNDSPIHMESGNA